MHEQPGAAEQTGNISNCIPIVQNQQPELSFPLKQNAIWLLGIASYRDRLDSSTKAGRPLQAIFLS